MKSLRFQGRAASQLNQKRMYTAKAARTGDLDDEVNFDFNEFACMSKPDRLYTSNSDD